MTVIPRSPRTPPSQPFLPYTRMRASPMITGDSANGRSIRAFRSPRPGNRRRTMASAAMIPNTVLTGTAMAVIVSVSQKADWNAGRAGREDRLDAALEGAPEDHDDGQREDQEQVDQGDRAQAQSGRSRDRAIVADRPEPDPVDGRVRGAHRAGSSCREMRRRSRS